ncbi:hypothetical protein VSH64_02580 [Amycolatopsis rhabdoformis]|uniref:SCO6045-like C-terminal domain-containing protein n=1 Tax=Amycolatopsis rhabdoformis TaxID=1448059 RepID=A0ABZ1IBA4_9PSEU|nr:hypothetical protein [Amycolatopsis rhabdoformis]WSE31016.1 hypothetical protein VSH64_02580 [Amycolatopsis rhabdoformis]
MSREALAARQAALLHALLTGAPPPPGFAPDRLRLEADVLLTKRRRLVAHLRPDLAETLGERFGALFAAYAAEHPKTDAIRARDYADAFAAWLAARGDLPHAPKRRRWFTR